MTRLAALAALALGLSGCIHDKDPWRPIGERYDSGHWFGANFSMDFPEGWVRINNLDALVASRDGWGLQQIKVRELEVGKALPHTKKMVRKGMTPQELAEVLVDDVRTDGSAKGLKVLEVRPATLSGQPGFRALLEFRDGDGLRHKAVLAGLLSGENCWQAVFVAPARHYFDLDLPTFDRALASFTVRR